MRSPAFSSEPRKPAPWWTGDLTPSVLHRKLEVRRWNHRVYQAATVPAWQCKKSLKRRRRRVRKPRIWSRNAYFSGRNRVPTPIFVERFLWAKAVVLFLVILFENVCKGVGLDYILAFILCKANCRPIAFGPILRPFLDCSAASLKAINFVPMFFQSTPIVVLHWV